MHLLQNLKFVHDHHDAIAAAIHQMTPDQVAEAGSVAAGRKDAKDATANPLIDLLIGLITDPAKLQGLLAFIMQIINLFPKKP
jgi:hypothetical protein